MSLFHIMLSKCCQCKVKCVVEAKKRLYKSMQCLLILMEKLIAKPNISSWLVYPEINQLSA